MHAANLPARRTRRPGSLSVEMLLLAPLLIAVVVAVVEFSLVVVALQKLEAASAIGARVAAQGGNARSVREAVLRALGQGRIGKAEVVADLMGDDGYPLPSGSPVEVIVAVKAGEVVPDLLGFIGFSIKDMKLRGRTLLRKE